jgi:steroid 5-alpha reductase family enzyme
MTFFQIFGVGALAILSIMTSLWVVSLFRKDTSIVDIFWGIGFVILTGIYFALSTDGYGPRKLILLFLVTIWGLRLGAYILFRNMGKGEDKRYQAFRKTAGKKYWWYSYFQVFMLQGALMLLISTPLLAAEIGPRSSHLTLLDGAGLLLWIVGFSFEMISDWQLSDFKSNPVNKGKVLNSGLWRYSRHPNYFGEAVLWWGYYLFAASTPGGFWTVYSPILMTILLLRVSGVALLEKSLSREKPEYRAYIDSTNSFIPWLPKSRQDSHYSNSGEQH